MPGFNSTKQSAKHLREAVAILRNGGVVLFPTETAYGLAADARNAHALRRVAAMKGREEGKTPPLIAASFGMAERYIVLSPQLKRLARAHWPGPLTIVAPARSGLASEAIRSGTIAIRVSDHPIAQALSKGLGAPIVATSANVAGAQTCYSVPAFRKQFASRPLQPDFVLDIGAIPRRKPSTIVMEENDQLRVLRQGPVRLSPYVS